MLPVLFKIGPLTVHTYGVAVALAFLAGIAIVRYQAKARNLNPDLAYDIVLAAMVGGIVGARILYVIKNWSEFASNPVSMFATWQGGLIFYGGLIGGTLLVLALVKMRHLSVAKVADIVAPALALGSAIGRIGCFANGCCYGKETHVPWAVTFTDNLSVASPLGVPLHPTQLYEFTYNMISLVIILWVGKRVKKEGILFWLYVMLYGMFRFIVEFFRADPVAFAGMSASQIFSIVLFVVGIAMVAYINSGRKKGSEPGTNHVAVEHADS
jgi:phosphatidylglycerol:prolipoprotein diacylglycerol transferase